MKKIGNSILLIGAISIIISGILIFVGDNKNRNVAGILFVLGLILEVAGMVIKRKCDKFSKNKNIKREYRIYLQIKTSE